MEKNQRKRKAIGWLMFALPIAFVATARADSGSHAFTHGTSFENQETGNFSVDLSDGGTESGDKYWLGDETSGYLGKVVDYPQGAAYDYAASGTARNAIFNDEPEAEEGTPGTNGKYLSILATNDLELARLVMPRRERGAGMGYDVSNVLVRASSRDGIYFDSLVRFTAAHSEPVLGDDDRIAVWLRDNGDEPRTYALMVSSGHFNGSFKDFGTASYAIDSPAVAPGTWHRITVRAISDITGDGDAETVPGFTVYVDGKPAVATSDYSLGLDEVHGDWLSVSARLLVQERRLFPWHADYTRDESKRLSRAAFLGTGGVDDILFTTAAPEFVYDDVVFSLQWDRGVSAISCIVSNADGTVATALGAEEVASARRCHYFSLGTNHSARVEVGAAYDGVRGYKAGVWVAEGDCTVEECTNFVYSGASKNPVGRIVTARDTLDVGGDGYATFAEAIAKARTAATKVITLNCDFSVSNLTSGAYRDYSCVLVEDGDEVTIDLCGHTLQGAGGNPTIWQKGGKLRITDTDDGKRGRVLAPAKGSGGDAVRSWADQDNEPELIIDSGWYDGEVVVSGKTVTVKGVTTNYSGSCIIEGGNFVSPEPKVFYLGQYVTNSSAYFGYGVKSAGYWSIATNGFIWCGDGWPVTDWTNPENWKGREVPGAEDVAIFPFPGYDSEGWAVNFGGGVPNKTLVMDGDIVFAGTNEFGDVEVIWGDGRMSGDGIAKFTGRLPGALKAATRTDGEIRLGDAWAGTVKISSVLTPTRIRNIDSWGHSGSKVEFYGVNGYVQDSASYDLGYELVLEDPDDSTPAWKNTTGFSGSTLSFATLSGSGSFVSPRNSRDVLQVIQFRSLAGFTGRFSIAGKRLLLGEGAVASEGAGSVTFADGARVRSGCDWSGTNAFFGARLNVIGNLNDTLFTYTGDTAPEVDGVAVHLIDPTTGQTGEYVLRVVGKAVVISATALGMVNFGGEKLAVNSLAAVAKSGTTFDISGDPTVTVSGNDVVVNGVVAASLADYYTVRAVSPGVYSIALNDTATPTLAEVSIDSSGGEATLVVDNARAGLWYALERKASLGDAKWQTVSVRQATSDGERIEFADEMGGESGFLRVAVSDSEPEGGVE